MSCFIPINLKSINENDAINGIKITYICCHCQTKQGIVLHPPVKAVDTFRCFKCDKELELRLLCVLVPEVKKLSEEKK